MFIDLYKKKKKRMKKEIVFDNEEIPRSSLRANYIYCINIYINSSNYSKSFIHDIKYLIKYSRIVFIN